MSMVDRRTAVYINQAYSVEELLWYYFKVRPNVNGTFKCPFHDDNRKSAQLFDDNRFFCYAECNQQFTPTKIMLRMGVTVESLAALVPADFVETADSRKVFDVHMFRNLSFGIGKMFKQNHSLQAVMDNWVSVLSNLEKADE